MSEKIKVLARRWFNEAWNERKSSVIEDLVHLHCVGHHEGATTNGREEVKQFREGLLALVPDIQAEIEDVIAENQNAVVRWILHGTSHGKPVRFHGMTWLRFADDQIIEGWDRWDRTGFENALKA